MATLHAPGALEAPKMSRRTTLIGDHPVSDAAAMLEAYEPLDVIGQGSFGIIVCCRLFPSFALSRRVLVHVNLLCSLRFPHSAKSCVKQTALYVQTGHGPPSLSWVNGTTGLAYADHDPPWAPFCVFLSSRFSLGKS